MSQPTTTEHSILLYGSAVSDIAKHIEVSQRVDLSDLDWTLAKRHGLTEREIECLCYFADIESQTIYYFLEMARLKAVRDPEFMTFLTMWNYEEYFHSHAITRLLEACDVSVESATDRSSRVRANARLKAALEDAGQKAVATLLPGSFVALWLTWGSTQELLTSQAYEQIATTTTNPVCAEVCRRIAKQERRHFAYYFKKAHEALEGKWLRQQVVRYMLDVFWSPVGNGVKTPTEAAALAQRLFPGPRLLEALDIIDSRVGALPGMHGLDACRRWATRMGMSTSPAVSKEQPQAATKTPPESVSESLKAG